MTIDKKISRETINCLACVVQHGIATGRFAYKPQSGTKYYCLTDRYCPMQLKSNGGYFCVADMIELEK